MWKTAFSHTTSIAVLGLVLCLAAPPAQPAPTVAGEQVVLVALLPAQDEAVTEALARGLGLAFAEASERSGAEHRLLIGEASSRWSNAAPEAVRLVFRRGARILITPPDRRVAHLLAQIGTRAHIPVISTSPAASVCGTGSTWVRGVVNTSRGAVGEETPCACAGLRPGVLTEEQLQRASGRFAMRFGREPSPVEWAGYAAGLEAARWRPGP